MRSPLLPRAASAARRLPAILAALLSAACASGGSVGGGGTAPVPGTDGTSLNTVRVDGGTGGSSYQAQLTHTDQAVETGLDAAPDRAYAVLPLVYEELGLKVNTAMTDARTVGVNGVRMRRVGKEPMSRFLSCGADVTGTPLADTYAVTLTVMSRVTPSGATGSLLSTQVLGTAQPLAVSGSVVTCQSTGALEERIARAAQRHAAGT